MSPKETKAQLYDRRVGLVQKILEERLSEGKASQLARQVVNGAGGGSEFGDFEMWLETRFVTQLVWLNEEDYTRAITRALPQALRFAASDFGSTRQRDLGQLWTDTARGFLGEIALQRFLREKLDVWVEPDISMDKTRADYILTDIKAVREPKTGYLRVPRLNVSIKTGKFNARWMDEYSAKKTEMIDALVFVRVGTAREHFIAYLKHLSFLGTKLFPEAERLGELTAESRTQLWEEIPSFEPIPAYLPGFLLRNQLRLPIHHVVARLKGGKYPSLLITEGVGNFSRTALQQDERILLLDPQQTMQLFIDGLGTVIDENLHFYANTGALEYGLVNWRTFADSL